MDFCGGGDLHAYYLSPRFNNAEFFRITSEILSGIAYLHQRKLTHRSKFRCCRYLTKVIGCDRTNTFALIRDLKPANILLEAGSKRVKIADFGLAKDVSATATDTGAGTPLCQYFHLLCRRVL